MKFFSQLILILALVISGAYSLAWEVDNFSRRNEPLNDSYQYINNYINQKIRQAVADYNEPSIFRDFTSISFLGFGDNEDESTCNKGALVSYLEGPMSKNTNDAHKELEATPLSAFQRHSQIVDYSYGRPNPFQGLIYEHRDFLKEDSRNYYVKFMSAAMCCDSSINLGGHYIGLDKLSHLFAHGFNNYVIYSDEFKKTKDKEKAIKAAIDYGIVQENEAWGLSVFNVKSYADLAANFDGLNFYLELLDGDNPIIQCKDGKYEVTRNIDLSKYVNDAWDEGINCSSFATDGLAELVLGNIKRASGGKLCPLDFAKCEEAKKRYGKWAQYVLHPNCFNPSNDIKNYREDAVKAPIDAIFDHFEGVVK